MTREERLVFCQTCSYRKLNMKVGLICSLTGKMADFEKNCPDYNKDEKFIKQEIENKKEKELAEVGRKKTMNVFYLLIGLSISVIIFSHLTFKPLNLKEITKELIRLAVELGLFYAIFRGKYWAKALMTILFSAGIIFSFISMIILLGRSSFALIFLILIYVYGFAVYFFNTDKDFKNFFFYQKKHN